MKPYSLILLFFVIITGCGKCNLSQSGPDIANGGRALAITRYNDDNAKMIVASESGGLFRTLDYGKSWNQISKDKTFWFTDVQYYNVDPQIVFATAKNDTKVPSSGGIWRSLDGGNSWEHMSVTLPTNQTTRPFQAYSIAIERSTSNRIWIGTSHGLAYSDNQGTDWTILPQSADLNYRTDHDVYSVISTKSNYISILTRGGYRFTTDRGVTWGRAEEYGDYQPLFGARHQHNQLAFAPGTSPYIYWAGVFMNRTTEEYFSGLFRSTNGRRWYIVSAVNQDQLNRPPFVVVSQTSVSGDGKHDVYFGDGYLNLWRATYNNSGTISSSWTHLDINHPDCADICLDKNGEYPILLASDGGLHKKTDVNGSHWTYICGDRNDDADLTNLCFPLKDINIDNNKSLGYRAQQITMVTGQLHEDGRGSDLYIATQDNGLWASPNNGLKWTVGTAGDSYGIAVPRNYIAPASTHFTGRISGNQWNVITDPILANCNIFNDDVPGTDESVITFAPVLMEPSKYMEALYFPDRDVVGQISYSGNNGSTWAKLFDVNDFLYDEMKLSKTSYQTTAFATYDISYDPWSLGIKKMTGLLSPEVNVISDVTGFGRMAVNFFGFSWQAPYAVDPVNPNHIIVCDNNSNVVKVTRNGGVTWTTDADLTNLIKGEGKFLFSIPDDVPLSYYCQVTAIAFHPEQHSRILVGTVQAGVFGSCDDGSSWEHFKGTENIPTITSFYFNSNNNVVISSYGRGLWNLKIDKCNPLDGGISTQTESLKKIDEPVLYTNGVISPLRDVNIDASCYTCNFQVVQGGNINADFVARNNKSVNRISKAETDGGTLQFFNNNNDFKSPAITSVKTTAVNNVVKDEIVKGLLDAKLSARGMLLKSDTLLGFIFSKSEIKQNQLPLGRAPRIKVQAVEMKDRNNKEGKRIIITIVDYVKDLPVIIYIDGEELLLKSTTQVVKRNKMVVEFKSKLFTGRHTVKVVQKTGDKESTGSALLIIRPGEE